VGDRHPSPGKGHLDDHFRDFELHTDAGGAGRRSRDAVAYRKSLVLGDARLHGNRRDSPARQRSAGADARRSRRAATVGAAERARLHSRARRGHGQSGRAAGARRPGGDLRIGLAGGRRREPLRADVPRPEPIPGELRPGARATDQQRTRARRPDRMLQRRLRGRMVRADRRRCRGGLWRTAQRLRVDAGDDRSGRGWGSLGGSARRGEEVRAPRCTSAR
jgi:hypothetical protein